VLLHALGRVAAPLNLRPLEELVLLPARGSLREEPDEGTREQAALCTGAGTRASARVRPPPRARGRGRAAARRPLSRGGSRCRRRPPPCSAGAPPRSPTGPRGRP